MKDVMPEWCERRLQELERALREQRALTELQKRRGDLLEQQVKTAFKVAGWPGRSRDEPGK